MRDIVAAVPDLMLARIDDTIGVEKLVPMASQTWPLVLRESTPTWR